MNMLTFAQVKARFKLGQAQAVQACARANHKKIRPQKGMKAPAWYYDPLEIAGIVGKIKQNIIGKERG